MHRELVNTWVHREVEEHTENTEAHREIENTGVHRKLEEQTENTQVHRELEDAGVHRELESTENKENYNLNYTLALNKRTNERAC